MHGNRLIPFGRNSKVILDDVMYSGSTFSFVGCIQISHIKCRSAYILYHIGHCDILTTFTSKRKVDFRESSRRCDIV